MADVVLTNTYFLQFDPKQQRLMQPYPPLGTLYAAAVLQENHITSDFFDNVFAPAASAIFPLIEKNAGKPVIICDDGFNYLTKMCLVNMRNACFEMIGHAKKNNCTVIISSSDATDHWKEYLDAGADYILIGEVENTLVELMRNLQAGDQTITGIAGLGYKSNGDYFKTMPREVIHQLDTIPLPLWHLVDIDRYRSAWMKKNGYFSLNMTTTRGCPFKCNWCAKPIYGNRYHSRSPENVVEELTHLVNILQVDHIWFCDDIFGLTPGWIKRFSELVQEKNLAFRFKAQCRVDLLLDENNIEHLAKAGCDEIWVGAESGSQKILDAMDKGTTVEQIHRSAALMKKHGIKPCFFLQFGYPGENKSDIDATIRMLIDLMPYDIGISVSYPLPGTKFYETVKNELKEKQNWNDSDELALMFHSTYSPAYYKQLHRYVHKRFRKAQGLEGIKKVFTASGALSKNELRRIVTLPYFIPMSYWNKLKLNLIVKN